MITKITEAVEKSANSAMFENVVFDEFTLLENTNLNESVELKLKKYKSSVYIDLPRKAVGSSENRHGRHNDRVKASIRGNTEDRSTTTSMPLWYGKNRSEYGDLQPDRIEYGTKLSSKNSDMTEEAIYLIYDMAKEEIKYFVDTDDISKFKKKVDEFNNLTKKEQEKYYV